MRKQHLLLNRQWLICNCTDCNGQLVDSRTKAIHESRHQGHQDSQGTFTGEFQQLELDDEDPGIRSR